MTCNSGESRKTLRELLKEGAEARAERDQRLAQDWFSMEKEAWSSRSGVRYPPAIDADGGGGLAKR